jgi:hypothetical protein
VENVRMVNGSEEAMISLTPMMSRLVHILEMSGRNYLPNNVIIFVLCAPPGGTK